jgi:hypothetical protein
VPFPSLILGIRVPLWEDRLSRLSWFSEGGDRCCGRVWGLYAALKRCSSTVLHSSCSFSGKSEINVNGVGQECPTHTGNLGFRKIPTGLFFLMFR